MRHRSQCFSSKAVGLDASQVVKRRQFRRSEPFCENGQIALLLDTRVRQVHSQHMAFR
jgi:hypothetical protein